MERGRGHRVSSTQKLWLFVREVLAHVFDKLVERLGVCRARWHGYMCITDQTCIHSFCGWLNGCGFFISREVVVLGQGFPVVVARTVAQFAGSEGIVNQVVLSR